MPRHAAKNETVTAKARALDQAKVTAKSGNPTWNRCTTDNVGSGKWGQPGFKDAKGARKFYNALENAQQILGQKRPSWNCAEVNAVAKLLDKGCELQYIEITEVYGTGPQDKIICCDSCKQWAADCGVKLP